MIHKIAIEKMWKKTPQEARGEVLIDGGKKYANIWY